MTTQDLIQVLQASIAPTVLISGVGLLLLSMVNRLARPIDRIRLLGRELKTASKQEAALLQEQIDILYKRCQLLQKAISLAIASIVCVSLIILLLFSTHIFNLNLSAAVEIICTLGLIFLIGSLICFLWDIQQALHSVKIEINRIKRF